MAVKEYKEYKSVSSRKRKKRISKKKQRKKNKVKKIFHNLFSFLMVIFLFPAIYFLFWGLIIEPNLPRHIYGPGDLKELIYLLFSLLVIFISYLMIIIIKYKPLNMVWWDNIKLLASVRFNLEKYASMKQMGIKYSSHKKKKKLHYYHDKEYEHKSITQ